MTDDKPKMLLELFEGHPERWCKGAMALDSAGNPVFSDEPAACQWCLFGALFKVYGASSRQCCKAIHRLRAEVKHIFDYNDDPTTTHADIVELCRKVGV